MGVFYGWSALSWGLIFLLYVGFYVLIWGVIPLAGIVLLITVLRALFPMARALLGKVVEAKKDQPNE